MRSPRSNCRSWRPGEPAYSCTVRVTEGGKQDGAVATAAGRTSTNPPTHGQVLERRKRERLNPKSVIEPPSTAFVGRRHASPVSRCQFFRQGGGDDAACPYEVVVYRARRVLTLSIEAFPEGLDFPIPPYHIRRGEACLALSLSHDSLSGNPIAGAPHASLLRNVLLVQAPRTGEYG